MSDSARDPYTGILREMRMQSREAVPNGMCLGVVKVIGPGVLQVQTDTGLLLDGEDLQINPLYAYDAEEELILEIPKENGAQLNVNREIQCLIEFSLSGAQIQINRMTLYDVPGKLTGTIKVRTRRLQVGDRVLLLPSADGQTYYLISKVVDVS